MSEERRSKTRYRVLKGGSISFGHGASIDCQVRNFSETGACLEVETPVGVPDRFILAIRRDAVMRPSRVKWRRGQRIGVEFE